MDGVSSKFSKLNPFGSKVQDDEELGDVVDQKTLAGGGHAGRQTNVTHQLRASSTLHSFLVDQGILSKHDISDSDQVSQPLRSLLDRPHAIVPPELTDRSHPLPDYFISSSHNTYLQAHQLYGSSSASAYETTLLAGSRCVEIDAWDDNDNKDEPKVTHGYTLTSHIPFRAVCQTIRDVVDHESQTQPNAAPILLSL